MPLCDSMMTASTLSFCRKPSTTFCSSRVADAEGPVGRKTLGMRDRHIRERLADNADAETADFFHHRRLEHAAGGLVEGRLVVEGGFLGQEHVLRQELALEAFEIGGELFLAVGEFPMPGHRLDAEQIGGIHHVLAVHGIGEAAALPEIAAVESSERPAPASVRKRSINVLRWAKPPSLP